MSRLYAMPWFPQVNPEIQTWGKASGSLMFPTDSSFSFQFSFSNNTLIFSSLSEGHAYCWLIFREENTFHRPGWLKVEIKRWRDFPGGSVVKNPSSNAGDTGSIPGSGRSPGEGNDNPLQYSCLKNTMDRRSLVGYSPWDCKRVWHNLATNHAGTQRGGGGQRQHLHTAFLNHFSTRVTKSCYSAKRSVTNPAWKRNFSLPWHLWSQ